MKASWALVVGIILGVAAIFLIDRHISMIEASQTSQTFLRLNPQKSLTRGETISTEMLKLVELPQQFSNLSEIAVPYNDDTLALVNSGNAVAIKDVEAGSVLLFEHIIQTPDVSFANQIGVGMRALSIPVTAISSVSYFVGPGSRVDILATMMERAGQTQQIDTKEDISPELLMQNMYATEERLVTKTLLQNVRVMAVGSSLTSNSYVDISKGYSTVTFEVTPLQAEILTFALGQAEGGLSLVLRNPENTEVENIPAVGWQELESQQ